MSLENEIIKINKPSIENNIKDLKSNENHVLAGVNNKNDKIIVRIIPDIATPDKIKNFYSNIGDSYITRASQKPNYMFEKKSPLKIDGKQISEVFITDVTSKKKIIRPRVFEDLTEKNTLNMPPVIEKDFNPKNIITFEKIGHNNELNFIEVKNTVREIVHPIAKVDSTKTILKRL
jgi:hypothetical protein